MNKKMLSFVILSLLVFTLPSIFATGNEIGAYDSVLCTDGLDNDADGLIDGNDEGCTSRPSSCVTEWIYDSSIGDYVKADWVHPILKKIINEHGKDSPEYEMYKNKWKTLPGEKCSTVNPKPSVAPKTETISEPITEEVTTNPQSDLQEEEKGFFAWLFSWLF